MIEVPIKQFDLSKEQEEVVNSRSPKFAVVAAAGAGKTSVLVERYIRLVKDEGLAPDEILTITFTKKAAAEMKSRIVNRLRGVGLERDAQIAETGPIQTIHSFCERLLRENSLEAGLDPAFEIMSESHTSRMVIDAIREVLASDMDTEPDAEGLLSFLSGKRPGFGEDKSPYSKLENAIKNVLMDLRGGGFERNEVETVHASPTRLRTHWEETLIRDTAAMIQDPFSLDSSVTFHENLQNAYKRAARKIPSWLKGNADQQAEEEALHHTCGLVQMACAAWWRLDREMNRLQMLDFSALEERALRLLRNSEVTRRRMNSQVRAVMVDESQDLNPTQYRLIEFLNADSEMLVGDFQQSIYGFRQADVEHFVQRTDSPNTIRLSRNYRSTRGVLAFVDHLFGNLWKDYKPMGPASFPEQEGLDFKVLAQRDFSGLEIWRTESKDLAFISSAVREVIAEGVPAREIAVLVRDGAKAQEMESTLRTAGVPARIVGGSEKFYTRLEVRDLANSLRAIADPYDDFSLLAALRSPLVGLSVDAIMLLAQERTVIERLPEFQSPIAEDHEKLRRFLKWYSPLRLIGDRLAAWEVLARIFAESDLLPALARREKPEQLLANVRKLLSLATQEPELGPLEYADRIREIQDLRHKEGDAPADEADADLVSIMTVHKSKGLEFRVVVLPQTDKKLVNSAKDLVVEPRLGIVASKYGKVACLMHKFLSDRKKERDEQEELRVLYVALTRAKERLCICLYPPKRDRNVSKIIRDVLGTQEVPTIRYRGAFKSGETRGEE
jgi:ATP-dependent helicase/nuclease subunit A